MAGFTSNKSMNDSNKSHEFCSDSSNIEDNDCRKLVKNILSQKIFVGEYVARRYVEPLQEYRDVVICRETETEIIKFLQQIQKHMIADYGEKKWIGITKNTETPDRSGYAFWCPQQNLPFGKHWFQIRSLKIKDKEIFFQLKCLRPYKHEEKEIDLEEVKETLNIKEICTIANLCEASKFSMVLLLTIASCLVKAGAFILDFLVKITHELSFLIQSLTPIIITGINTVAKCIGGLYWLIYMLLRGNSAPPMRPIPMNENQLAIMGGPMYRSQAHLMNDSMSNLRYMRNRKPFDNNRRTSGNYWVD